MHIIEQYNELIDKDPDEIASMLKNLQIFLYFVCSISGYICSTLFYIIWYDICEDCPLWAELRHTYDEDEYHQRNMSEGNSRTVSDDTGNFDWTFEITGFYNYGGYCEWFHLSCILSCFFGVVWIAMFTMCGKGGWDSKMYTEAWRIVIPALVFNLIFTIIIVCATAAMKSGLSHFIENVDKMTATVLEEHYYVNQSQCKNLQDFTQLHNTYGYNACKFFMAVDYISWIMMIGWIGGTILLILRVINVQDFRLVKITLYQMSPEVFKLETLKRVHEENVEAPSPIKKIK